MNGWEIKKKEWQYWLKDIIKRWVWKENIKQTQKIKIKAPMNYNNGNRKI